MYYFIYTQASTPVTSFYNGTMSTFITFHHQLNNLFCVFTNTLFICNALKPRHSIVSFNLRHYDLAYHHYNDDIMSAMASQITSITIVYSTVYSGADQRKHRGSASLAFEWRIHRWPVNSPHKWPVTRKMFPFDDVIILKSYKLGHTQCIIYAHMKFTILFCHVKQLHLVIVIERECLQPGPVLSTEIR